MTDDEATLRERVSALEETVAELNAQLDGTVNRDVPLLKGTVRAVVDAEIDDIGELPDAGRAFNRQVATHGERLDAVERQLAALGDVETVKTTKAQKLAAISAFALNKRGSQSTVAVTAEEIQGCVGVSRRYAYDLIDKAVDALDGVRVREASDVRTSTGVEHKKKALLVDCEAVHTNGAGVNQFITAMAGDEPDTRAERDGDGDR